MIPSPCFIQAGFVVILVSSSGGYICSLIKFNEAPYNDVKSESKRNLDQGLLEKPQSPVGIKGHLFYRFSCCSFFTFL